MFVPGVFFLMLLTIGNTYGDTPVFLWGSPSEKKPALYNVKQNEFAKIMKPMLQDSMIVAFIEPELNTIDFRMKTDDSESCYSNMKEFPDYTYFTSVQKPVEALRELTPLQEYAIINKDGDLEPPIEYQIGKVVLIDLINADEKRSLLLKKHDDTINKVYQKLSNKGKVTGVYTSSKTSKLRIRRETKNKKQSGDQFIKPEFLFYYSMLQFKEHDKDPVTIKSSNMDVTKNNTNLSVKLTTDDKDIKFDIIISQGYYKMNNLKLGDQAFLVSSTPGAPMGFSYVCGNHQFSAVNLNPKDQITSPKLIWHGLQMQALSDKEQEKKTQTFGEPWDCSGYYTPGILSGLFVVFMLLIILAVAVAWIMDINTMDRFENNRSGKTITINATE